MANICSIMNNKRFVLFVAALLYLFFQSAAYAQSQDAAARFLQILRSELVVENQVLNVKSVLLKDNTFIIDAVAGSSGVQAELICDVLLAAKKYSVDNPGQLPVELKEMLKQLDKKGVSFRMSIAERNGGKKYNLDFTAKEFSGFYMLQNLGNDPNTIISLLAYLPFEKVVGIMNMSANSLGPSFSCEGERLYIVMTLDDKNFLQMHEMFNKNRAVVIKSMQQYVLPLLSADNTSSMCVDLARKNGYRLALRIVCPGNSPIAFDLE